MDRQRPNGTYKSDVPITAVFEGAYLRMYCLRREKLGYDFKKCWNLVKDKEKK